MVEFWVPTELSGEIVSIERLEAAAVLSGIAHWRRLRADGAFPPKADIVPREFGDLLGNIILVRVLEGGGDYEYRIVGDALVPGFSHNFAGRKVSDIVREAPKFGLGLRMLYEMVRGGGEPLGYRGWVGKDMKGADFSYHENALLPFGPDRQEVDHLLVVSAITRHPVAQPQ